MFLGIGLSLKAQLLSGVNPFASLMSTLLADATQLIAHPLEYGSMFQDRAGTTPVTEPGQLVGMVLDHGSTGSKPVAGPELVTNGTFDTDLTGWGITGSASASSVDSKAVVVASAASGGIEQIFSVTAGKTYEVMSTIISDTGVVSDVRFRAGSGGILQLHRATSTSVSTQNAIVTAVDGTLRVTMIIAGAGVFPATAKYDNISVRELPGYHATAISDAARGVFRDVGGFRWVEYNGINGAYSTPALAAPLVDKAQVFAGVRKLSDATFQTVVEFSSSIANDGSLNLQSPSTVDGFSRMSSRGTVQQFNNQSSPLTPATFIITGQADISGDFVSTRVSGINDAPETADQGTGNFNPSGTYPLYYGARAGTSLFFNGRSYATLGPITRFSAANATAAQIEAAEAYYTARVI